MQKKTGRITLAAVFAGFAVFVVEALLAFPGPDDHFQNPEADPVDFGGEGERLVYAVLGDSTAAGRGGSYDAGIAIETARHLARSRPVSLVNLAVSGATVGDVRRDQLPAVVRLRPDVVLLSVGANDVIHFTPSGRVRAEILALLEGIVGVCPGGRVVLMGSPDLGAVPRFAQPLRWLAGTQARRVNRILEAVAHEIGVIWAPIARDTGLLFRRDRTLLAPDRFHPNERGYATFLPDLCAALDGVSPPL